MPRFQCLALNFQSTSPHGFLPHSPQFNTAPSSEHLAIAVLFHPFLSTCFFTSSSLCPILPFSIPHRLLTSTSRALMCIAPLPPHADLLRVPASRLMRLIINIWRVTSPTSSRFLLIRHLISHRWPCAWHTSLLTSHWC